MIDYAKLKQLREETGVSYALCKKALEETSNNLDEAKKKLISLGATKVTEKASRTTSEGGIFAYVHHNRKIASLVELLCETDFVAKNDEFLKLGNEIAMQVASIPAKDVNELLKQEYIRDPSRKVNDLIKEAVLKYGENVKVNRIERWTLGY